MSGAARKDAQFLVKPVIEAKTLAKNLTVGFESGRRSLYHKHRMTQIAGSAAPASLRRSAMASKTVFTVQAFRLNRGQLIPGKREEAPTDNGAIKKAAAWASRELGVAALKIVADDEGQVSEAVILAQHGRVPEDFLDQVKGG